MTLDECREVVERAIAQWKETGEADARHVIQQHPELAQYKALMLELAYEEFCCRQEDGQALDSTVFCDRFPSIRTSLAQQLEVHKFAPILVELFSNLRWPQPGEDFAHFKLVEEIGRGAMARVFLAIEPGVGRRRVVVKVSVHSEREADTLGKLLHPGIVSILTTGWDEDTGLSFISMPFCGRSTLCDVLDKAFETGAPANRASVIIQAAKIRTQPTDRFDRIASPFRGMHSIPYVDGVLNVAADLAQALEHAHAQGVLHGDIKPSNILITPNGRPMLLDFNLAHERESPKAMTGGTLPYMAPEQIRATVLHEKECVDQRTDIYSFGVILHELLTGRLPHGPVTDPVTTRETAERRLAAQKIRSYPPTSLNPAISPRINTLLQRCLEPQPEERPQSMVEVSRELARHFSPTRRAGRWVRRHPRRTMLAACTTTAPALLLAYYLRPLSPNYLYQRALSAYRAGKYESARGWIRQATDRRPKVAAVHYLRGLIELRSDNFAVAETSFLAAQDLDRNGESFARAAYCASRCESNSPKTILGRYRVALLQLGDDADTEWIRVNLFGQRILCGEYDLDFASSLSSFRNRDLAEVAAARLASLIRIVQNERPLEAHERAAVFALVSFNSRHTAVWIELALVYAMAYRVTRAWHDLNNCFLCLEALAKLGYDVHSLGSITMTNKVFADIRESRRFGRLKPAKGSPLAPTDRDLSFAGPPDGPIAERID